MQKKASLITQLLKRRPPEASESLFTTLLDGMESLPRRLKDVLRADWKLGHGVESISPRNGKWEVAGIAYDQVIVASSTLPHLEIPEYEEIGEIWKSIRKNSAVVIAFAFHNFRREGFGWLVPASERHSILACTYVSNKFPRRSPEELFLVRTFIGGDFAEEWIDRSDQDLQLEALHELKRIASITEEPAFCRIFRWRHAMPEYQVGHSDKIERMNFLARSHGGLAFTGNIFAGVGVPDCIQHAEDIVSNL
jgi:oxygen-dependent protoporphyrinogen oxidase